MTTAEIFLRQAWLVEFISTHPGRTMKEIFEQWDSSPFSEYGDYPYKNSTFWNDVEDIREKFGLEIFSHRPENTYYIRNAEDIYSFKMQRWLMNIIQAQMMFDKCKHLKERFLLEEFPTLDGVLQPIIQAMTDSVKVRLLYQGYSKSSRSMEVAPYCIKAYKHRLYVLGRFDSGNFSLFSFDRIRKIELLSDSFTIDETFNAKEYFKYFYGVMTKTDDLRITEVILRAHGDAQCYLRDCPMHHSQREISSCKEYADFKVTLYPSRDFLGDIIQQGGRVQVISPVEVQQRMAEIIAALAEQYR